MAIVAPAQPLGRVAFFRTFARNPLEAIPRAVYEEDFVPVGGARPNAMWVTSPALVKAVLLDERDKFRKLTQIRLFRPLLGKGLLTTEGAEWKWQRQAASPMFRPEQLASFVPRFVHAADDALGRWRAAGSNSIQTIDEEMTRVTFDVICSTVLPSKSEEFAQAIQHAVRTLQRFGGWDILYAALNLTHWMPRPGGLRKLFAMRTLRSRTTALLRERQGKTDDLLQRLIEARDPESGRSMGESQLVDNLLTFYLAGHETTAKALTWTLYLLARHADWARRLEAEIERVTGGGPIAAGHLERLVLVQQVIQESMRLYPPVPIMSRQCVADTTIAGHDVTTGASVLIPIWCIHRHRKRWDRPDEFDPTRFAPEREAALPRYQFMPFGAGPRVCIGRSFAMMEATAIVATLLRAARFELVDQTEPHPLAGVTLMPRDGLRLAVSSRLTS